MKRQESWDKYRMIRFGRTTDRPTTGRPVGGQTHSNVANVVIVIGLIFRCGATRCTRHRRRRYGCGSLRIHETVETRLCSSFRRTDAILSVKHIAIILLCRVDRWRGTARKRDVDSDSITRAHHSNPLF